MRYGIGPRRRRVPDPAEEAAEAENWLADYRESSEESGDEFPPPRRRDPDPDDPFANNGNGGGFDDFDRGPGGPGGFDGGPGHGGFDGGSGSPGGFDGGPGGPGGGFGGRPGGSFGHGGEPPEVPAPLFTEPPPPGEGPMPFGGGFPPPAGAGRVTPNYDEPTGSFGARPSFDEPTGGFNAPPRGEPTFGGRAAPPPREEPTFGGRAAPPPREEFGGRAAPPPREEPTFGGRAAPPPREEFGGRANPPSREEPIFGGRAAPPPREEPTFGGRAAGSAFDEPTGGFGAPSAGGGGFAGPSGGRSVTPSYDEPTGGFSAGRAESTGAFTPPPGREEPSTPFGGGSAAGTVVPRRPPAASPHADEEPIFKPFDASAPPVVPPSPPQEEPILKYMSPGERARTRSTYGGRRRAPDQRPAAVSAPPMSGPPTSGPPGSPAGGASGRRRRYRDEDEAPAAGFAPDYQQPFPNQPAAYAEQPGYSEPPARPARLELPSRPTPVEPEPSGYGRGNQGYAEAPPYAEPGYSDRGYQEPGYQEPGYQDPGYSEPGYQEPAAAYAEAPPYQEQYADPRRDGGFRREADYPDPRYDEARYPGEAPARQPELPAGPGRMRRDDDRMPDDDRPARPPSLPPAESMRTVSPDTTGDMPRVSTTGSIPRLGSGTTGTTGRVASVGSATTGSLPRIGPSTTGSLRPVRIDPVRPASRRPSTMMVALASVGVLVLFAVCGLSTWFVFQDELSGDKGGNNAQNNTPAPARDITSREADPTPLTDAEVFPLAAIAGQTGNQYTILKKEAQTDCAQAATEDLAKLLADNGCSQVVRGTMKSGDGVYYVTAGIFNLKDEPAAINTHENIEATVKAQKGRFTALLAGAGTEVLTRAPMVLGWHARGHFLAYCVIARVDGQGFDAASQGARDQIQADILTAHLRDAIIGARAATKAAGSGAPSPSSS